ncbi:stage III sporulation protein AH [Bacillus xiamenensis]|uniref:SpoIIIAH-like family protein n=1 Tax=Bacillus xiamenensis TaxID=1178537 RepID=A0AAC9IJR9_9BACI|nr:MULTISPECIES: SpoIIIAH-like family protein [Bacillus]AOZ90732.1 stage III sporulation protein AH [Bacillus xiamenensis]EKF35379.1 stage III sporulation protein AH [Bacillus xiamenensis]MBG9911526.1 stage III sporulation protein AH [Bacillus xiamenensis]MCW1837504.1 SpoIIIAH-like family protein [Bacillus xiamenensis]MCY9576677.1 SpoIIIAH-like family protein [Bacillus xiamenensis]
MLKKQTVWLLTMLSLVVVLSVYYIMSPQGENAVTVEDTKSKGMEEKKTETEKGTEKGAGDKSTDKETNAKQEDVETSGEEGKAVSEQTDDELFTTYRLELEDKRSKQREEFNEIVSSDDATAQEKSEAYDQMTALSEAEGTERQLETLIKTKGYKDALVSAEGDKVSITVRSDKKSKSQAADIIDLVTKEMRGLDNVAVTFEPSNQ